MIKIYIQNDNLNQLTLDNQFSYLKLSKNRLFFVIILICCYILSLQLAYASDVTISNVNASCETACVGQTSLGKIKITGQDSAETAFAVGADSSGTVSNCIDACYNAKAKVMGGVADVRTNVSSNSFTRSMCNALRVVTGSAGKTFAAFAIIAVGIGFFSGKVSWGLMIGVAAGIAAMFGAPSIVAAISGTNTKMDCGIN